MLIPAACGSFFGIFLGQIVGGGIQIAGRHQLAPNCDGNPLNMSGDRLGQALYRQHQGRAVVEQVLERGGAWIDRVPGGLHLLEIMPGAERLAAGHQNDDADRSVAAKPVQFGLQGGNHGIRQGIERGR